MRLRLRMLAWGLFEPQDARPVRRRPGVFESEKLLPGRRFVLAGRHPLQLVVADQLLYAGAELAALSFAQPRPRLADDPTTALACVGASPPARARRAAPPPPRPAPLLLLVSAAEGSGALEGVTLRPVDDAWQISSGQSCASPVTRSATASSPSSELPRQGPGACGGGAR